jgi:glycosyltransferase involved in cell wall biosynthesis
MSTPRLSVIVIGYNMARELPRTIRSLSPAMQRDIDADDYEIIVVDNGSTKPFDQAECRQWGGNISFHTIADAPPSPALAINHGLSLARGDLVGVCIDGARMATPRLLATALEAARLHRRPVVGTLAFHLGPDVQMRSVANGYCQQVEDGLLESVDWVSDGYQLFSISVLAGSSQHGWFVLPAESNAIFLVREHWSELGGYDTRFTSPGGGLVNLDTWARACADPSGRVIMLLGEATFHQFHGGVATGSAVPQWQSLHAEYVRLRGSDFKPPQGTPRLLGSLHPAAHASLKLSIERLIQSKKNPA